ncbi:DUF6011 domain-containing protein [Alicyclobacillus macrosporangiidus]|uniref:Uncharacterized protein n=1 Tax=Alicyclobacillus macrosporangiidus TaxID=392015 RepID=A0A1I7J9M6_9BACL|nr:DUF6011 domain-containing protein [Alicyclobacillus macrosporangiidus]SFU81899.1 hypothetical protein SAMN05421543_10930 [Alicyclobacillus macrosporangiidus]
MGDKCRCCGRALTDERSIARGMGPICYGRSGGGVFDKDLTVDDAEWARRKALLERGGEIDLGANWPYLAEDGVRYQMRISVRYRDGKYEAYGALNDWVRGVQRELLIDRGTDLRRVYESAVLAGPQYAAAAEFQRRMEARQTRKTRRFRAENIA